RGADRHILDQGFANEVAQKNRWQLWRLQLAGQDDAEGIFQLPMPQHRGEPEADQHWFTLRLLPGLGLNLAPESILAAVHQVLGQLVHRSIPPLRFGLAQSENGQHLPTDATASVTSFDAVDSPVLSSS